MTESPGGVWGWPHARQGAAKPTIAGFSLPDVVYVAWVRIIQERPEAGAAALFSYLIMVGKGVMPVKETIMLLALIVQVVHVCYLMMSQKK